MFQKCCCLQIKTKSNTGAIDVQSDVGAGHKHSTNLN